MARALSELGHVTLTPELDDDGTPPFWTQHVEAAAILGPVGPIVLVGHSGAGPLLPAIGARCEAAGYVFVDAGLPAGGRTRMEMLEAEEPALASQLRTLLEAGGAYPAWTLFDLEAHVPDGLLRHQLVHGLRPRRAPFWDEPIDVPDGWPDAPVSYLRLSEGYESSAAEAERRGWPVRRLVAGHFHMLVDPAAVAEAIVALAG